jgi:polyisoprenyl-phosphate glycosyltransferase
VFMDCDLQDDPGHISKLIQKHSEGYDVVFTKRISRKHSIFKQIASKIYNALFWIFSDKNYDVHAGSLVLFTKKVREEFLKIKDKDRLYIQVLKWIGFKQTYIEVEHRERQKGKSSYTFIKLIKIAIQGWTSHSDKLLKMSIYLGFLLAFVSFLSGIAVIAMYFLHGLAPGWPSIIIAILFSTGIILISIGTAGIYIGKIFDQVKGRPLYIISEKVNC